MKMRFFALLLLVSMHVPLFPKYGIEKGATKRHTDVPAHDEIINTMERAHDECTQVMKNALDELLEAEMQISKDIATALVKVASYDLPSHVKTFLKDLAQFIKSQPDRMKKGIAAHEEMMTSMYEIVLRGANVKHANIEKMVDTQERVASAAREVTGETEPARHGGPAPVDRSTRPSRATKPSRPGHRESRHSDESRRTQSKPKTERTERRAERVEEHEETEMRHEEARRK